MICSFLPSLDTALSEERLKTLLVSGNLEEPDLSRRVQRLELLFRLAALASPVPLWAPGLRIVREWRTVTETFLPWAEIAPAFRRLISRALRYPPPSDPLAPCPSWPDFLNRNPVGTTSAKPALLLQRLLTDEAVRRRWLFTLFLPKEHGGGFGRYPAQSTFLRDWLTHRRSRTASRLSCLDAACGCGEGTWELAQLCRESGFRPEEITLCGSSLDPLELFAAAHAAFPHDARREREYRLRILPHVAAGFAERIHFVREDLSVPIGSPEKYDLILCNGLLGGPLLHEPGQMERVMVGLVRRLKPEGVILAADRFHEGWRKLHPNGAREALLSRCGVRILECGEGIGGERISE
jgi:chemotaxis methyl-accepting protein methylase